MAEQNFSNWEGYHAQEGGMFSKGAKAPLYPSPRYPPPAVMELSLGLVLGHGPWVMGPGSRAFGIGPWSWVMGPRVLGHGPGVLSPEPWVLGHLKKEKKIHSRIFAKNEKNF